MSIIRLYDKMGICIDRSKSFSWPSYEIPGANESELILRKKRKYLKFDSEMAARTVIDDFIVQGVDWLSSVENHEFQVRDR